MRKAIIFLLLLPATLLAQREPVLKQIDLPHPYYYREMYLPQLTSGPSWVTWSPDSKEVIYSMAGSLWRQKIDTAEAVQLTDGPGYDYQPDWSRDGKYVVYTKYYQDAMELWLLDLAGGKTSQLTKDGAVNVEPRWSPDGKRIAYVSTAGTKHFHIWLMEMQNADVAPDLRSGEHGSEIRAYTIQPKAMRQLTKENVSTLPRYYYSKFDHEISPAWSPDGKDIVFVSNHGHIHGTGGIWRATVPESGMIDTNTNAKEIHYEETNWKARPEFSPDGKKIVYASYLGRQWHQLWLMPSQGGDVFPLTYGEYDNINPRWSPDGKKVAYISNQHGNLDLWTNSFGKKELLHTWGNWQSFCLAPTIGGKAVSVRVVSDELIPTTAIAADDSFFPGKDRESHYFIDYPQPRQPFCTSIKTKAGSHHLLLVHGLETLPKAMEIDVPHHAENRNSFKAQLQSIRFGDEQKWVSGDLHLHSNYGGHYRENERSLGWQLASEDLTVGFDLLVNKEQRFPSIARLQDVGVNHPFRLDSGGDRLIATGQEFHTSYWGHLGLLNTKNLIIPGYVGYPNTAAASLVPMNADVADMAHAKNKDALVGYVHPFDVLPDPYKDPKLTDELPVDVALGKVDYYEVVGFSDHKASAAIWYRLLNLGFHLPAGAGTDAMTNFASLRGPVGLNRVYVRMDDEKQVPRLAPLARDDNSKTNARNNSKPNARNDKQGKKPLDLDLWLKNLKAGKTFATNGPLLRFSLGGQPIGGELKLDKPGEVKFTAALRSIVPVDKVEVVCDGVVAKTLFPMDVATSGRHSADQRSARPLESKDSQGHAATTSLDVSGAVPISNSGWCVLRAYSDHAEEPIMDIYPYGTTSPIYVTVAGEKPRSPEDARFFSKWIERTREDAAVHPDYNTPQEREHVLKVLDEAGGVFRGMQEAGGGR